MRIFEVLMLICFGMAWPFSIIKSIRSKETAGKSVLFLYVIFLGYIFGIIHKFLFNFDKVTYLYVLNATMVFIDLILYYKNRLLLKKP